MSSGGSRLHFKGGPWTNTDDQILLAALSSGNRDWERIASHLKKTAAQCRERWESYLDPRLHLREEWTVEEDALLVELHQLFPFQWKLISSQLTKKSALRYIRPPWLCQKRYTQLHDIFTFEQQQSGGGGSASSTKTLEQFIKERERAWRAPQSHEEAPARLDTVTGGEANTNREEMLNVVIGRLANQDRKKGLRKERQRQLEEASFLAKLQNQREAMESGTLSSRQHKRMRKALEEDGEEDDEEEEEEEEDALPPSRIREIEEQDEEDEGEEEGRRRWGKEGQASRTKKAFSPMSVEKGEVQAGTQAKSRVLLKSLTNVSRAAAASAKNLLHGVGGGISKISSSSTKLKQQQNGNSKMKMNIEWDASSPVSAPPDSWRRARVCEEEEYETLPIISLKEGKDGILRPASSVPEKKKKKEEEEEESNEQQGKRGVAGLLSSSASSSSTPPPVAPSSVGGIQWDDLVLDSVIPSNTMMSGATPNSSSSLNMPMLANPSHSNIIGTGGGGGGVDLDLLFAHLPDVTPTHISSSVTSSSSSSRLPRPTAATTTTVTTNPAPAQSSDGSNRRSKKDEKEKMKNEYQGEVEGCGGGPSTISTSSSSLPSDFTEPLSVERREAKESESYCTSFSSSSSSSLSCESPPARFPLTDFPSPIPHLRSAPPGAGAATTTTTNSSASSNLFPSSSSFVPAAVCSSSASSFSSPTWSRRGCCRSRSLSRNDGVEEEERERVEQVGKGEGYLVNVGAGASTSFSSARMKRMRMKVEEEEENNNYHTWMKTHKEQLENELFSVYKNDLLSAPPPLSIPPAGRDAITQKEEEGEEGKRSKGEKEDDEHIPPHLQQIARQLVEDEVECISSSSCSSSCFSSPPGVAPAFPPSEFVHQALPLLQKKWDEVCEQHTAALLGNSPQQPSSSSPSSSVTPISHKDISELLHLLQVCFINDDLRARLQSEFFSFQHWAANYQSPLEKEEEEEEEAKEEKEKKKNKEENTLFTSTSVESASHRKGNQPQPPSLPHHTHSPVHHGVKSHPIFLPYFFLCDVYQNILKYWENVCEEREMYLQLLRTIMHDERHRMEEVLEEAEKSRQKWFAEERKWQLQYGCQFARQKEEEAEEEVKQS